MPNSYYDESDQQTHQTSKNKPSSLPKFVKNSMENICEQQIVINTSKTQYEVVESAAEELGWVVETSKKSQNWDIMWVDTYIEPQELFRLNDHQKISHFPGIDIFAKKNLLGRSLMKMSKHFPEEYNYFPYTWSLPSEFNELKRYQEKLLTSNKKQVYIFKPSASCQGKGIKLTQNIDELEGKNGIAQIYVNNPLLIQNLKFDLRLYVLIYGHDPMRIYLYEEGLARFATQSYAKAEKTNMKDTFVHLTNYAINKNNKKFVFNKDESNMDKGHKRSVSSVYRYLAKKGVNQADLKKKIQAMIVKTLLIGQPMLSHIYHLSQPDNLSNDLVFHILGFDVLITQDYDPILLQINHTPSFTTDTPLDKKIKKNLIKDTFKILNINVDSKKEKINKKMEFLQKRSQRKNTKLTNSEKSLLKQKINNEKNGHEDKNPCEFKRIYPLQNQIYQKIEAQAVKIFQEENRMKANKSSPVKGLINEREPSPSKYQRSPSGSQGSGGGVLKKNHSYQQANSFLKKTPYSQTLPMRSINGSKLPSISLSHKKEPHPISLSAHFPKTIVKKIEFRGQEIFKDIQKRRILSTQRIQKKKNSYFIEQNNSGENNQQTIIPSNRVDLAFYQTQTLAVERKTMLHEKQKQFFEFIQQSSVQLLRIKRNEKEKLRNILFTKKKAISHGSSKK